MFRQGMKSLTAAKSFCFAASLACFTLGSSAAYADDATHSTTTIHLANTPIMISGCKVDRFEAGSLNVYNRSDHFLESVTIRWTVYNHSGERMGQGDEEYGLQNHAAPGDSAFLNQSLSLSMSDRWDAVDRVSCRLQAAKFEGNRTWEYGRAWAGRLSPLPQEDSFQDDRSSAGDGAAASASRPRTKPQIALAVANAWNDSVDGEMYVHVALDIQGGHDDAELRPQNVRLTMALANGTKKSYSAMATPAPRYQKMNPLIGNPPTIAFEVDPKDDLGSLGSFTVPAHATAHVVATFIVGSDVVANPKDNRQVTLLK